MTWGSTWFLRWWLYEGKIISPQLFGVRNISGKKVKAGESTGAAGEKGKGNKMRAVSGFFVLLCWEEEMWFKMSSDCDCEWGSESGESGESSVHSTHHHEIGKLPRGIHSRLLMGPDEGTRGSPGPSYCGTMWIYRTKFRKKKRVKRKLRNFSPQITNYEEMGNRNIVEFRSMIIFSLTFSLHSRTDHTISRGVCPCSCVGPPPCHKPPLLWNNFDLWGSPTEFCIIYYVCFTLTFDVWPLRFDQLT